MAVTQQTLPTRRLTIPALLLAVSAIDLASADTPIDSSADWHARTQGAIYAENFEYTNKQELIEAAAQVSISNNLSLETVHTLSGKGVRIAVPASGGANTGSWHNYINGKDDSVYKRFYLQFVFYADEHWLNFPFKQNNGNPTSPKIIIIDQWNSSYNPGEVVLVNRRTSGFVGAYRGTNSNYPPFQLPVAGSSTPCPKGDPDYLWQFPLDEGTPNHVVTCEDYKRRYGPLNYNLSGSLDAGRPLDEQGTPDPDAAVAGVTWVRDGFTVVEVFIDHDADVVKIWANEYGQAPKLIVDSTVLAGGAQLGGSGYTGFQLTPYRTNGASNEPGRKDTYVSFVELVVSSDPIAFPGGYSLPSDNVKPKAPTDVTAK